GRRAFAQKDWLDASKSLEVAATGLATQPDLARQTLLMLGQCYEQLNDPDRQYGAYRRALTEDPFDPVWLPASHGVARALLQLNNPDEALAIYRRLAARVPAARLVVARLLIARNLGLPEKQRDWREVASLLDEAARLNPNSVEAAILRTQMLALSSEPDKV